MMIRVVRLRKEFRNGVVALDDVSLRIGKGEFAFLMGPSGAGKSTLLNILSCLIAPTAGRAFVDGKSLARISKGGVVALRRRMGLVFQEPKLLDTMSVYDNVAFALRVIEASPDQIRPRVLEVLGLVGMDHRLDSRPDELSAGERQRVAIARAVVNKPALVLADEPTGNLDSDMAVGVVDLLSRINASGATILMATHNRDLAKRVGGRVIYMQSGRVVQDTRHPHLEGVAL